MRCPDGLEEHRMGQWSVSERRGVSQVNQAEQVLVVPMDPIEGQGQGYQWQRVEWREKQQTQGL